MTIESVTVRQSDSQTDRLTRSLLERHAPLKTRVIAIVSELKSLPETPNRDNWWKKYFYITVKLGPGGYFGCTFKAVLCCSRCGVAGSEPGPP